MHVHHTPKAKKSAAPAATVPPPLHATVIPQKDDWHGFLIHAGAAVAAIVAVVVLSQGALREGAPSLLAELISNNATVTPSGTLMNRSAEIGLEHTKPVTLTLSFTTNGSKGVADIRHDALETVYVSLPSSWIRREVGGVPLAAVTADPPSLGFTRWSLPSGAVVSFDVTPPSTILLHNPSGIPAEVELTRVDLAKNSVERDIILVQEGSTLLW